MLIPLALTSTNAAVRRLGFVRWKRLHRLVYLVATLGLIHFYWRVKADKREPLTFAAIVGTLLMIRVAAWAARKAGRSGAMGRPATHRAPASRKDASAPTRSA